MMLDVMTALVGLDGIDTEEALAELTDKFAVLDRGARVLFGNAATGPEAERVEADVSAVSSWVVDTFVRPSLERRRQALTEVANGERAESDVPNDLLTAMLRHSDHFTNWSRDEEVYEREAIVFLIASIGSTIGNTAITLVEIEDWLAAHPADAHKRTEPGWIFRCVRESARIHGIPMVPRLALADSVLPSGLHVHANDLVWVNMRSAVAERFGPDHATFNPDRDLPAAAHLYGLAFGDGRQTCPGKGLVLNETIDGIDQRKGVIASMLLKLFAAGMQLDRARAVKLDQGRTVFKFVDTCPVVFTDL